MEKNKKIGETLVKIIFLFLMPVNIQMVLASPKISLSEYKNSCEERNAEGCVELGNLYYEGKEVELECFGDNLKNIPTKPILPLNPLQLRLHQSRPSILVIPPVH